MNPLDQSLIDEANTPPPEDAAPQAAAPAAPTPALPTWDQVEAHPDYQASTPEDKLVAFDRWHNAAYNLASQAPNWNEHKDEFNQNASEISNQLSSAAGGMDPNTARLKIAHDTLTAAQAKTPNIPLNDEQKKAALDPLGEDISTVGTMHPNLGHEVMNATREFGSTVGSAVLNALGGLVQKSKDQPDGGLVGKLMGMDGDPFGVKDENNRKAAEYVDKVSNFLFKRGDELKTASQVDPTLSDTALAKGGEFAGGLAPLLAGPGVFIAMHRLESYGETYKATGGDRAAADRAANIASVGDALFFGQAGAIGSGLGKVLEKQGVQGVKAWAVKAAAGTAGNITASQLIQAASAASGAPPNERIDAFSKALLKTNIPDVALQTAFGILGAGVAHGPRETTAPEAEQMKTEGDDAAAKLTEAGLPKTAEATTEAATADAENLPPAPVESKPIQMVTEHDEAGNAKPSLVIPESVTDEQLTDFRAQLDKSPLSPETKLAYQAKLDEAEAARKPVPAEEAPAVADEPAARVVEVKNGQATIETDAGNRVVLPEAHAQDYIDRVTQAQKLAKVPPAAPVEEAAPETPAAPAEQPAAAEPTAPAAPEAAQELLNEIIETKGKVTPEQKARMDAIDKTKVEAPAVEPAPEAPAVEPAPETPAVEPAPEAPAVEPAPEAPAVEPAPEAPVLPVEPDKLPDKLSGEIAPPPTADEVKAQAPSEPPKTPEEKNAAAQATHDEAVKTGIAPPLKEILKTQAPERTRKESTEAAVALRNKIEKSLAEKYPEETVPEGATETQPTAVKKLTKKDMAKGVSTAAVKTGDRHPYTGDHLSTITEPKLGEDGEPVKDKNGNPVTVTRAKFTNNADDIAQKFDVGMVDKDSKKLYLPEEITDESQWQSKDKVNPAIRYELEDSTGRYYVTGVDTHYGEVDGEGQYTKRAKEATQFDRAQALVFAEPKVAEAIQGALEKAESGGRKAPAIEDLIASPEESEQQAGDMTVKADESTPKGTAPPQARGVIGLDNVSRLDNLGMFEDNGGNTAHRLLTELSTKARSPIHRVLAKLMLASRTDFSKLDVKLVQNRDWAGLYRATGAQEGTMFMNIDAPHRSGIEGTLLHEMYHHVTQAKLDPDYIRSPVEQRAYDNLKQLYDVALRHFFKKQFGREVKNQTELDQWAEAHAGRNDGAVRGIPQEFLDYANVQHHYGLSRFEEFPTEAITSPIFAAELSEIPNIPGMKPSGGGVYRNLYEAVKAHLKELFANKIVAQDSVMWQAIESAQSLIREPVKPSSIHPSIYYEPIAPSELTSPKGKPTKKDLEAQYVDLYGERGATIAKEMSTKELQRAIDRKTKGPDLSGKTRTELEEDFARVTGDSDSAQTMSRKELEAALRIKDVVLHPEALPPSKSGLAEDQGWLSPKTEFTPTGVSLHEAVAKRMIDSDPKLKAAWEKEGGDQELYEETGSYARIYDFMERHGFVRVAGGGKDQTIFATGDMTTAQKRFLKESAAARKVDLVHDFGGRSAIIQGVTDAMSVKAEPKPPARIETEHKLDGTADHKLHLDPDATRDDLPAIRDYIDKTKIPDADKAMLKTQLDEALAPKMPLKGVRIDGDKLVIDENATRDDLIAAADHLRNNKDIPAETKVQMFADIATRVLSPDTAEGIGGIKSFANEEVIPRAKGAANLLREARTGIVNLLWPSAHAKTADLNILMKSKGYSDMQVFKAGAALEKSRSTMKALPRSEQIAFADKFKNGKEQATPELQQVDMLLRELNDRDYAEVTKYKPDLPYLENHLRALWKVVPGSPEARGTTAFDIRVAKKPWRGSQGFLKKSVLESLSEGIALGGEPVSYNPVELALLAHADVMKFVSANRAWEGLKKTGSVIFVKAGEETPDGYRKLNDQISKVYFPTEKGMVSPGEFYVHDGVGRLLNNHLGKDFIRENSLGRAAIDLKNMTTAMELSLSPFHAIFESNEVMGSSMGLGLAKISEGQFAEGFKDVLGSFTSPVTTAKLGGVVLKFAKNAEEFKKSDPKTYDWFTKKYPAAEQLIEDMFSSGGTARMHSDYEILAGKGFAEAMKEENYASALMKAVPALNRAVMKPLFETYIPRLKMGMFLRDYSFELSRRAKDLETGKITRGEVGQGVWNFVDDRFGELNWDNLFWDRTFKSGMQLAFRSVTWKLGNLRGFGKAAKDTVAELGVNWWKEGRAPRMTLPMAWLVGMSVTTALQSTIISKVTTGKYPWELATDAGDFVRQLVFPRVDEKDPSQRVSVPTYWRDAVHLAHSPSSYVTSSMSGEWGRIGDVWNNKDYYGTEVYHPDDPLWRKGVDAMEHMVPLPFGLQSYFAAHQTGASTSKSLPGFFGFTKAPGYVSHTAAEIEASEQFTKSLPSGNRTKEDYQRGVQERMAVQAIKRGDTTLESAVADGHIQRSRVKYVKDKIKDTSLQYMVSHLGPVESMKVYEKASATERKEIAPLVLRHIARATTLSPETRQKLLDKHAKLTNASK